MALALARSLVRNGGFSINDIRTSYVRWYRSGPFDIGRTTTLGLEGEPILESQANGALMRISPLGVFGWKMEPEALAKLAAEDAALTHPNPICGQVNGLYRLLHKSWHVVVTQVPAFSVARAWRSSPSSLSLLFIDRIALPAGRMMRPAR